jgi:acyl transferase domain-containing protein
MATQDKLREYLKRVTVDLTEARRRLAEAVDDRHEPVAVIGLACRYPGGSSVEGFWELLHDGRSGVIEVPPSRWDVDEYYNPDRRAAGGVYTRYGAFLDDITGWDAEFFGVPPAEASRMDPNQRLLMELVWEGLENAGISPAAAAGSRTAVLVGLMDTLQYGRLEAERQGPGITADPYFGQGISTSVVAGRLAYHFDLHGPAVTLDTACSSSLVGLHLAAQALRGGECDLAVAAGSYLIMQPDTYVQGCATSMLAPDGRCKTFDITADGYVMGEGGGLVVLERLSSALRHGRHIRAVLRGSAVNQDGRSNGLTAPSRGAQADVIRQALAAAKVDPDDVDYLEAHGSGTRLGDAIELSALHDVFGGRPAERALHVGAVKTNIGHTQSAAGVAGLIKTVLALEHGLVPASLHLTEPTDALPPDGTIRLATEPVRLAAEGRRAIAGVSSFGWSGTNAHLVLEAPPPREEASGRPGGGPPVSYTLPVSAASEGALADQLRRLSGWLAERPGLELADVAHTLTEGRAELDYRYAVNCTGLDDAVRQLASVSSGLRGTRRARQRPRVVFLLPGVGDQYPGIGLDLYRTEPVYAEAVDRCLEVLKQRCAVDLRPAFCPADGGEPVPAGFAPAGFAAGGFAAAVRSGEAGAADDPVQQTEIAHPFQFTVEYAVAKLLASWGVTADVLVGYSLGEYVAACLAGVFTLEDALYLVAERARLITAVPAGRMLAVAAGEQAARAAIAAAGTGVDIAALNGPSMTVLSGAADEVAAVSRQLTSDGIACRALRTTHAFHSRTLEPARDKLAALVESVPRQAPTATIVSNRTGAMLTPEQAVSSDYWADHLLSPVRFGQSVRHCLNTGADVFVELGAGQTLAGLVRQNLPAGSGIAVFGTLPSAWTGGGLPEARTELLTTCARLWETGVTVDWAATRRGTGRIVTLPGYAFQRTRYWPEPAGSGHAGSGHAASGPAGSGPGPVAARPAPPADLAYATTWRRDPARPAAAPLALAGTLLLFSDGESGIGASLAERAAAAGTPVIEVIPGPPGSAGPAVPPGPPGGPAREGSHRIVIDPAASEQYREVLAGLDPDAPLHVVHLWSLLAGPDSQTGPDSQAGLAQLSDGELREAMSWSFDSLMRAAQALSRLPGRREIGLLTASRGATEIIGADLTAPYRAAVHGLGRVAQHELAGLTWRGVDLDTEDSRGAAGQLAHELLLGPAGDYPSVTGWRRGSRWVPDFSPVDLPGEPAPAWRPDGVYLITGGTRGLGLALARHLVRSGVRRLALVGRTALRPAPGAEAAPGTGAAPGTQAEAAPGTQTGRAAQSLRDVAELEAAGAQVLLLAADAGQPGQLREALQRCREHFGALHGVVHAAGLPAGGMLQLRTPGDAAAVLAPKVMAMGPLAELVGPQTPAALRPELLVLYSSAITAFGGIGEGDYCAANTVLDAYGAALASSAPSTRVLTVAWGPWRHDDWQAAGLAGVVPAGGLPAGDGLAGQVRAHREKYGFADEAGCAFLDRLIASGYGSLLAVRQPVQDSLREWSSILDIDALVGAVPVQPAAERFPRPRLRTEFVAPRTELEKLIAGIWGSFLGIDQIGVHDPFFELGGNSLVGLAVVHAVESETSTVIAPATLFGNPTVAQFATALEHPDTSAETTQELLSASVDRGRRRRGTRPAERR